jgi:hypothetical protein
MRGTPRTWILALLGLLAIVWLPRTWQDDINGARADIRLSPAARENARGPAATAGSDLALVLGARSRIPRNASFALVRGGRFGTDAHPNRTQAFVWESGQTWTQFALAPRVEVSPGLASWLLIRDASPTSVGHAHPGHQWRYGSDWLVQVRT